MTKQKTGLLLVAVIFGAMFFFTTMASAAKPIELSLGLIVPPKHLRYRTRDRALDEDDRGTDQGRSQDQP